MKVIIILILVYLFSVYGAYKYIQKSFSTGGQWDRIDVDGDDVMMTLLPLINTIITLFYLADKIFDKKIKNSDGHYLNKIYGVKK